MTALKPLTLRSQQGIRKSNGRSKSLPLVPMARTGPLPLSFAQQRLWFLEQVDQGTGDYIIPVALRLCGVLNVQALERSFTELIRRHEMLRTTFQEVGGVPIQVIEPESTFTLSLVEVEPHSELEQVAHVEHIARKEAQRPFDLRQGPLMRATLLKLQESEHVLLVTIHHIISDGWSRGVFHL